MRPITALFEAVAQDVLDAFPNLACLETEKRSPTRYASRYLLDSFRKKFRDDIDEDKTNAVALATFNKVNTAAGLYSRPGIETREDQELYDAFKHQVSLFFSRLDWGNTWSEVWQNGDLGPGASIGSNGNDFYTKLFSSDLTTTNAFLYTLYKRSCKSDPTWFEAETARRLQGGAQFKIVEHGKLQFVPKNDRTSRTIETQATLNMFFQRGISRIIEKGLQKQFLINLACQPGVNRELARRGSIDGSLSTLDLSSASDHISLALFKDVVPRTYWDYFLKTRSEKVLTPAVGQTAGATVQMHMLSGMGNGYTFSFQTLLFACMVKAAFVYSPTISRSSDFVIDGVKVRAHDNWAVFGDDIIVPSGDMTVKVCRLLRMCGFSLNAMKSFYEGPFRESCGRDYLRGVNVRPVFIKSLKTQESRYVAINRLIEWSAEHGVLLRRGIAYLRSICVRPLFVPPWCGLDSGIRVDLPTKLRLSEVGVWPHRAQIRLPRRVCIEVFDDRIAVPKGVKPRRFISAGVLIAVLRGDIRGARLKLPDKQVEVERRKHALRIAPMSMDVRSSGDSVAYRTREITAPNWLPAPELGPSWARSWGATLKLLF